MSRLLLLSLFIFEFFTFSFVGNLQELIKAESNRFFEKNNFLSYSTTQINDEKIKSLKVISIEQDFLLSTLLRVKSHHEKFIDPKQRCSIYRYLISGLAQNSLGPLKNVAINTNDKPILISLLSFYKNIMTSQCPNVTPVTQLFSVTKYKQALNKVISLTPKNPSTCENSYQKILYNSSSLNLCSIYENNKSKKPRSFFLKFPQGFAKELSRSLNKSQNFFLENLCLSTKTTTKLCKEIFEADHWQKMARGESSSQKASIFCGSNPKKTRTCLNQLSKQPQSCHFPKFLKSSLLPVQDCEKLSLSFNNSRLNTDYPECPYSLDNLGLVASTRLISHLKKLHYPQKAKACLAYPLSVFLNFNLEIENDIAWAYQLCYHNKIDEKEQCYTSLMGTLEESKYSQDKVITKILKKTGDLPLSQNCKSISQQSYKPTLLKFQSGCFVIYNSFQCKLRECDFQVINNGKSVKDKITVKGVNSFNFIPHSRDYRKLAQSQLITQQLKKKTLEIRSLSVLTDFLKSHPNDIAHGAGCAQSLLPRFFKMKALNECTPLPFIVDSVIKRGNETLLVTRTALDHLHTPRLIPWHRVFSAIKLLYDIHPQKIWSFHGVY